MVFDREYPRDAEGNPVYPALEKYTSPVKKAEREIVGREVEKGRVMAAMNRPELCNVMLLAEAGSGKGHPLDAVIAVADERGYITMGELKIGDFVYGEDGQPVRVIGIYNQGLKEVFKVTFADGSSVLCNDEHLWDVRSRAQHYVDSPYVTMTTREIIDAGLKFNQAKKDGSVGRLNKWYIPVNKSLIREPIDYPIDPYVMGCLIGDGCLLASTFEFSSNDEPVVAAIAEFLGTDDYYQRKSCHSWVFRHKPEDESPYRNWHTDELAELDLTGSFGLDLALGKYSIERRIPPKYLIGSEEQRYDLLRGLMDTDGTVDNRDRISCQFSTNSEGLANDVVCLATSLGIRTALSWRDRNDTVHKNREYRVYFILSYEEKEKLFRLPRHLERVHDQASKRKRKFEKHFDDMAIESIEDLGYETEMVCIWVDSRRHLYQIGREHIVTHNTALVQGLMVEDEERYYLEVDLAHMIADLTDKNQMADKLKGLFDEVARYCKAEQCELVLFIDEFHQVVELSPAAVEALKPLLADSGTRGIRVVAATTFVEFRKWISPNQPLVERLQRINLEAPDKHMVVSILRGMARRYGVENQFYDNRIFEEIYDLTNRYIPANAQPRKSILVLDAMVGWHRYSKKPMDRRLLADVIYESEGVNIAFRVDASNIKRTLDEHVFAQELASTIIQDRLQICVADLNNKTKPMSSFLFTGSTGVGKMLADDEPVPVYGGPVRTKRHGDLVPGDMVFNRSGKPVRVTDVFPQGVQDVYVVELADGRRLRAGAGHLWNYRARTGDGPWRTGTTEELMARVGSGLRVSVPANGPVEWPEANLPLDPYAAGVVLASGYRAAGGELVLGCGCESAAEAVGAALGIAPIQAGGAWSFGGTAGMACLDGLGLGIHKGSCGRRIPEAYRTGSVEQRMALVRGMFDARGRLDASADRYNLSFCSASGQLVRDLQDVLFSLGHQSSVSNRTNRHKLFWSLHVQCRHRDKPGFFLDEGRRKAAEGLLGPEGPERRDRRHSDQVAVRSVEKTGERTSMSCIMVDDPEHLYQAGQFVVTHNTEMTKTLAEILFNDPRKLIRFDMTEFANEDSLDLFRRELTSRVWERPYSIVLLDEIEKACAPVTRILLQVLDDGRLTDENNREVPFINSYIILTTNAGSEIYKDIAQYNASDTGGGENMAKYQKLIRSSITSTTGGNRFPPELLGRIDCIVPFQPLSEETQKRIVISKLKKLQAMVEEKHGMKLKIRSRIVEYLVKDGLDTESDAGGARAVISKLESEVTTAVARAINQFAGAESLLVDYEGEPAYANKKKRGSSAHIVVSPVGEQSRAGFGDMR